MNIGEKIKNIRTAKLMTQKQLAGDKITRNMLSRIENGAAQPSLGTIHYIAARLNISPGYLLADGEDEELFRKIYRLENIKRAYRNGELRICRDLCRDSGLNGDDEINLILAQCSAGIAKEEFAAGRLRAAGRFFEEAVEYAEMSIYNTDIQRAQAAVYFRYMRRISATLGGELPGGAVSEGLAYGDPFCLYVAEVEALDYLGALIYAPPNLRPAAGDAAEDESNPFVAHIKAKKKMLGGDFREAQRLLHSILTSQSATPDPVLYDVFYDLEICSKEIDDYRGAYEYAANKISMLEKMLSEAGA